MSPTKPTFALPPDLLGRLSRALEASEPARALRQVLSSSDLPEATRERVVQQALLLADRACKREPRAPLGEVQLALGVLLVSCRVLELGRNEAAS